MPTWPNPSLSVKVRTWLPGDAGWAANITTPDAYMRDAEPEPVPTGDDDAYRKAVFLGLGPAIVTYGQGRLPADWSGADEEK